MAEEEKKKRAAQKRDFDVVVEGHINAGDYDLTPSRVLACLDAAAQAEGIKYWTAYHTQDFKEDGTLKRPHFHIVLRFPTRHTQNAIIRYVANTLLDVPKDAVSVAFVGVLYRRIRYLMHLDELGTKTIYPIDIVKTNDKPTLINAYNSDTDEITSDYLLSLVASHDRKADILQILGVSAYSKYRPIINDLWNEKGML